MRGGIDIKEKYMTELKKIEYAKSFIDKLANGMEKAGEQQRVACDRRRDMI